MSPDNQGAGHPTGSVSAVIKLSSPATHEYWEVPVVFENALLLALDKPSGLLTSPDRYDPQRPNLMKLLHAGIQDRKPWAAERNLDYLMNPHRLDSETSGVLLLAKEKPVLVQLANMFGSDKALKKYVALVRGAPAEDTLELDQKLAPHPTRVGVMRVDSRRGKRSRTVVRVLERFTGYTLLECEAVTDRTHQIRVHLQYVGLPIVGDSVYGGGAPLLLSRLKKNYSRKPGVEERPLIGRVALHAEHLQLSHPRTGDPLSISAPLPKDFTVSLKYLRRYANLAVT